MERKRKLPARAAARVESEAKRRHSTPREPPREPSEEPAPAPTVPEPSPPPPLPRSVQAGKPLPTVEDPQPEDLSTKEYQSVGESGVLAESLVRSRHKWINEGLFQKHWAKPHKRKGVVHEEPNNPPKHLMSKVGTVTITIEPHIIDATMYIVTDPDKAPGKQMKTLQATQSQERPIIQYGPPKGSMPPPVPTKSEAASPTPDAASPNIAAAKPSQNQSPAPSAPSSDVNNKTSATPQPLAQPARNTASPAPAPSPSYPTRPPSVPATSTPPLQQQPPPAPTINSLPPSAQPRPPSNPPVSQAVATRPAPPAAPLAQPPAPVPASSVTQSTGQAQTPAAGAAKPAIPAAGPSTAPATKAATSDPVIALLAQKASGDAELRDLMKRVAVGQAKQHELNHFQSIINQLNADYKRGGGQHGPSADRLLVDGRTVRYFADEVCAILDIVLASNPNQRAADLRPPPRSDPLVVLVVKTALEDKRTKDMCRRIATGKPGYTDATDLKEILDRLHRDSKIVKPNPTSWVKNEPAARPNPPNGIGPPIGQKPAPLRTKGHNPTPKPEVSAVVFDFGTGDRYLFPKFSILEFLATNSGQLALASFFIVRKGSTSEYGGDPELDYYQPVTIKLQTPTGRHLENLAKVVAPQDEVRRYMNDVMDNMTRAEYILLAMRLPRAPKEEAEAPVGRVTEETKTARSTPQADKEKELGRPLAAKPPVLWMTNTGPSKQSTHSKPITSREAEEETQAQYMRLINSVAAKESAAT